MVAVYCGALSSLCVKYGIPFHFNKDTASVMFKKLQLDYYEALKNVDTWKIKPNSNVLCAKMS